MRMVSEDYLGLNDQMVLAVSLQAAEITSIF